MVTRKQLFALSGFVLMGGILILMGREDPSQKAKTDDRTLLNKSVPVVNQKSTADDSESATATRSSNDQIASVDPTTTPTSTSSSTSVSGQPDTSPEPETSQSVVEKAFPPHPGREVFLSRCTQCHSLQFIAVRPNLSKAGWEGVISKMISTHGADISAAEAKQITEYLSAVKGLK